MGFSLSVQYDFTMNSKKQTPEVRCRLCSPAAIGLLSGVISMPISLIYAVRQRSWRLAIPFLAVFVVSTIVTSGYKYKLASYRKFVYNVIVGCSVYSIAKDNKEKAKLPLIVDEELS